MRRWIACLLIAPVLAGCDSDAPSNAQPDADLLTSSSAPSLAGTSWEGTDSDGDHYVYRFIAGGHLAYTSPTGTFDQTEDSWSQSGPQVTMKTVHGYSTRVGTLSGDTMSGTASNVANRSWTWSAQRRR